MKQLLCAVLTVLLFFCNQLNASEKNKIIENLRKINSLQFNFTQLSGDGQENGSCILVYPKKMRCIYDEQKKEIIVNDDYLYLINKEENKNYNYSIKDTPLGVMLDKESLIEKLSNIKKFNISNNFIIATVDISSAESTLNDNAVTIRERDSMKQERVSIDQVEAWLAPRLLGC